MPTTVGKSTEGNPQWQWPAVGDQVAIYDSYGWRTNATIDTVARRTLSQIILTGGRRFRINDHYEVGAASSSLIAWLLPVDDPRVLSVMARSRLGQVRVNLETLFKSVSLSPSPDEVADILSQAAIIIDVARARLAVAGEESA